MKITGKEGKVSRFSTMKFLTFNKKALGLKKCYILVVGNLDKENNFNFKKYFLNWDYMDDDNFIREKIHGSDWHLIIPIKKIGKYKTEWWVSRRFLKKMK